MVTIKEYFPAISPRARRRSRRHPRSEDCSERLQLGSRPLHRGGADAGEVRSPATSFASIAIFRANNTAYMVLHFEEGQSLKAWLKTLGRAPRQKELDRHHRAAARCARDHPQSGFPASRYRARQHHHPHVGRSGADRLRRGARRHRRALENQNRVGPRQAGLQPLRAVCRDEPPAGPWTDIYALGGHALSCRYRQAAARFAVAHAERRNGSGAPKRHSALIAARFSTPSTRALALAVDSAATIGCRLARGAAGAGAGEARHSFSDCAKRRKAPSQEDEAQRAPPRRFACGVRFRHRRMHPARRAAFSILSMG